MIDPTQSDKIRKILSQKISITLDDEVLDFVDQLATNLSRFINHVLWKGKRRILMEELADDYRSQEEDPEFQQEVSDWDNTVSDSLLETINNPHNS